MVPTLVLQKFLQVSRAAPGESRFAIYGAIGRVSPCRLQHMSYIIMDPIVCFIMSPFRFVGFPGSFFSPSFRVTAHPVAVLSMGLFQACRKHIDRFCERDSSTCIDLCNYEVLLWRLCIGWKVCARRLFSDVAGGLFVLLRYFGRIGFPYRNGHTVLRQYGIVCRNDSFLPNLSFDGTAVTDAR